MTKCKFCTDDFEYNWTKIDGKWKLANPNTGSPHICKKNKPTEISASTVITKHEKSDNDGVHSKLWKKDWEPAMDLPVKRFCGFCDTELVLVNDCPCCARYKLNPCPNWCGGCDKHPEIINVRKG